MREPPLPAIPDPVPSWLKRNPGLVRGAAAGVAGAVVWAAGLLGVHLDVAPVAGVVGMLIIAAAPLASQAWSRSKTTPTADPRGDNGQPLVPQRPQPRP